MVFEILLDIVSILIEIYVNGFELFHFCCAFPFLMHDFFFQQKQQNSLIYSLRATTEALLAGTDILLNKPVASETKEEGKEEAATASARHRKKGQLPGRSDSISSQVRDIHHYKFHTWSFKRMRV